MFGTPLSPFFAEFFAVAGQSLFWNDRRWLLPRNFGVDGVADAKVISRLS